MGNSPSSRRAAVAQSIALMAAGALAAPCTQAAAKAASSTAPYRVVFQVSDADPQKWNMTRNNIRNAQAELGRENTEIELVAFGPGVGMLIAKADVAGRVGEVVKGGVSVYACENTMRGQNLPREQMHELVRYAPSGVARLIRRQSEGYAYIRA